MFTRANNSKVIDTNETVVPDLCTRFGVSSAAFSGLEQCRQAFIAKYQVHSSLEHQVGLTIPAGHCILDLLQDAQVLAIALHKTRAVYPELLEAFAADPAYSKKSSGDTRISIRADIGGLDNEAFASPAYDGGRHAIEGLEGAGFFIPNMSQIAAAHSAHLVAYGKSLFPVAKNWEWGPEYCSVYGIIGNAVRVFRFNDGNQTDHTGQHTTKGGLLRFESDQYCSVAVEWPPKNPSAAERVKSYGWKPFVPNYSGFHD